MARFATLLAVALLAAACSSKGPTAEAPWVLVLSEAPTHEAARSQAETLARSKAALEGASGLTVRGVDGGLRHLVVSPPQATREALRHLSAKLAEGKPIRLEQLDARTVQVIPEEQAFGASPPEQVETLEQVAKLLPAPGELELGSFLILADPSVKLGPRPRPPGRSGSAEFSTGFGALGWQASGEATYSAGPDKGRVMWFVGRPASGQAGQDKILEAVHTFLLAHVRPEQATEVEPEDLPPAKRRKAVKRKRRRRRRPEPPPEEPEQIELVPVATALPLPVTKAMPWGAAQGYVVERIGLEKPRPAPKERPRKKRRRRGRKRKPAPAAVPKAPEHLYRAFFCQTPDKAAVVLVLFDDPAGLEHLAKPTSLVAPSGLAHSRWVNAIWAGLPEITLEDERFEYLAMQRLADWLPGKQRRASWAKPLAAKPVLMAGYRGKGESSGRWQLNWLQADSDAAAQALFEQGLVAPRQALMQRILKAKHAVSYEVGITLRETGDVQAWHLNGAQRGRLQELYFKRGRQIWIVRAGVEGRGGLSTDGLQGRVELLQIWDSPPN